MSNAKRNWRCWCVLLQAAFDAILFPFRMFFYFLRRKRFQNELRLLLKEPSPGLVKHGEERKLPHHPKIFLSVGDVSAEPHALRLIESIRQRSPQAQFLGFGGARMQSAGCRILFNPIELALIGFTGPAKQVPAHFRALKTFLKAIDEEKPDLVILLDYPGFHLYLAKLASKSVPVIYYICPQIWAWAPWRISALQKYVRHAYSILPFEVNYFRSKGIHAEYVGHPIADQLASLQPGDAPKKGAQLLCLLPGSRGGEVKKNLPAMLRVAKALHEKYPGMQVVLPHERENLLPLLREICATANFPVEIRPGRMHETLRESHLVFVKSGTAVLEVAHFEVPMLVFYKFDSGFKGAFSDWMRRHFLMTPYFTSINLLAAEEIVPEFAYGNQDKEKEIFEKADRLWQDGLIRERCIDDLRKIRQIYDCPGTAERVAELVLANVPS